MGAPRGTPSHPNNHSRVIGNSPSPKPTPKAIIFALTVIGRKVGINQDLLDQLLPSLFTLHNQEQQQMNIPEVMPV